MLCAALCAAWVLWHPRAQKAQESAAHRAHRSTAGPCAGRPQRAPLRALLCGDLWRPVLHSVRLGSCEAGERAEVAQRALCGPTACSVRRPPHSGPCAAPTKAANRSRKAWRPETGFCERCAARAQRPAARFASQSGTAARNAKRPAERLLSAGPVRLSPFTLWRERSGSKRWRPNAGRLSFGQRSAWRRGRGCSRMCCGASLRHVLAGCPG
jgi:hypothetical protein